MATAIDNRLQFHLFFWYGVIALVAFALGGMMAANLMTVAFLVAGVTWLATLPYHAQLGTVLSLTTFGSALIVPMLNGRPFVWEVSALLGWTGVVVAVLLRRYPPDLGRLVAENRWLFIGAAAYCLVLVVNMVVRGVGLRILGSAQMGGRFYLQQVLCAIFPLLFMICRIDQRQFVRLYTLQWALSATFLISDLAFSGVGAKLLPLLYFLELPNDALNFEVQSLRFGLRRFQSLAIVGQAALFLVLCRFNLRDFIGRKAFWLLPVALGGLGTAVLSGHRWVVVIVSITLLFVAYAQRFFTTRNVLIGVAMTLLGLVLVYGFVEKLPLTAQRALSFLPALEIDKQAELDAASTMFVRKALFRIGLDLIPEYFWLGRGFARYLDDYSAQWDPTTITFHVNQGKFYNGFIGLMINTGVLGTSAMLLFIFGGTRVAVDIIRRVRRHGCGDTVTRVAVLVAGIWFANVLGFIFLNGDSEWAMKTFSLLAGMLLLCQRYLGSSQEGPALTAAQG